jgi:hypothetical protein
MEYAGAVEVDPPFRPDESAWLVDAEWTVSGDGTTIRPHERAQLAAAVGGLRGLVVVDAGARSYDGVVAAYDPTTRRLVIVSARGGSVTQRTLRKAPPGVNRDNVIDLASHRRTVSRQIG